MTQEKNKTKKQEAKPAQSEKANLDVVATRGRTFEGTVVKKFSNRVAIEFERTVFIQKYERFAKKRTKIHARLPAQLHDSINVGDYILVQECRPLSKIIHAVVVKKIRAGSVEELSKLAQKQEAKK